MSTLAPFDLLGGVTIGLRYVIKYTDPWEVYMSVGSWGSPAGS